MADPTDDELIKGIKGWLESKGFPFEMLVSTTLNQAGFGVRQAWNFEDPETRTFREIDILAFKELVSTNLLLFELIIECKRSRDPFVAFAYNSELAKSQGSGWLPANKLGRTFLNRLSQAGIARRLPILQPFSPVAYSLSQAHLGNEKKTRGALDAGFDALAVVTKAAYDLVKTYDERATQMPDPNDPSVMRAIAFVGLPVIILDAPLYICYLEPKEELTIRKVEQALVEWSFPAIGNLIIRVLTAAALPQFCAQLQETSLLLSLESKPILAEISPHPPNFTPKPLGS